MDLRKQGFQTVLERPILGALVELAHEMATRPERIGGEFQSCFAKVLYIKSFAVLTGMSWRCVTYHAAGMVPEVDTACIHHPVIRITQASLPKSLSLFPGSGHITEYHIHCVAFLPTVTLLICLLAISGTKGDLRHEDSWLLFQLQIAPRICSMLVIRPI